MKWKHSFAGQIKLYDMDRNVPVTHVTWKLSVR